MMRPAEAPDHPLVEWQDSLTADEKSMLACINAGNFEPTTQFCKIGYQEVQGEVAFSMMHPCISIYYIAIHRFQSLNQQILVFKKLNQDYNDYHAKKCLLM